MDRKDNPRTIMLRLMRHLKVNTWVTVLSSRGEVAAHETNMLEGNPGAEAFALERMTGEEETTTVLGDDGRRSDLRSAGFNLKTR